MARKVLTTLDLNGPLTLTGNAGNTGQILVSGATGAPTWTNGPVISNTTTAASGFGYMGVPQVTTSTALTASTAWQSYAGKHIYTTTTSGLTHTIPSNATLALPIGTTFTFINPSGISLSIAIQTDTMYLAGTGTTGTRTLAQFGMATAIKITSTSWIISGNGLS